MQDWASLVDGAAVQRAGALAEALRGKGAADPMGRSLGARCFQQPNWRSPHGFVSVWPSRNRPDSEDQIARAFFFRYGPYGLDGDPWSELQYPLSTASVHEAAVDVANFLAPHSAGSWTHPPNLRGRRSEHGTFVVDLIHEFGHAVLAANKDGFVERVVLEGVELDGDSVNVNVGGHVIRSMGLRPFQMWDTAIVAVAGLVAEMLHTNRAASFERSVELFLADRNYLSDLEGAVTGILGSREVAAMEFDARNQLLERAVAEARETLLPLMPNIEREANSWKNAVVVDPVSTIVIEWTETLHIALCGA